MKDELDGTWKFLEFEPKLCMKRPETNTYNVLSKISSHEIEDASLYVTNRKWTVRKEKEHYYNKNASLGYSLFTKHFIYGLED